mmetsp:Transcript_4298/g.12530  ORF Transcript_4298/g.12530 Transcript_4298/m.12530 type:complete len:218 (-) Transcript_4298:805-1458(-)
MLYFMSDKSKMHALVIQHQGVDVLAKELGSRQSWAKGHRVWTSSPQHILRKKKSTTETWPFIRVQHKCFRTLQRIDIHGQHDKPEARYCGRHSKSDQVHRPQRAPLRQLLAPGDQHDAPGRHGAVRARLPGGRRRPLLPAVPPTTPPQLQERLPPPSQAVPASGVRHDHVRRQQSILRRLVPRDAPQRLPRHRAPPRPPRPRRLQLPAFQPASDEAR